MEKSNKVFQNIASFFRRIFSSCRDKATSFYRSPAFPEFINGVIKFIVILVICFLSSLALILISSKQPGTAIKAFFEAPFADADSLAQIIDESLPLIFTGVAVCIMDKAGMCNMFVEGGFFAGAFIAAYLAPLLPIPGFWIHVFCILAGGLLSGLLGLIPAFMRSHLKINEFVSSLMLNYIVFWIVMFLLDGPCADPNVANKTRYLEDFMKLAIIDPNTGLSDAIFLALAMAGIGYVFLQKTVWGYRIRMTGDNVKFAEYSGISVKTSIVLSQVIGAVIAGIGGAVLMLGGARNFRFEWKALPNYGFDGFVIAIMAADNPLLVPLASLFLAYLRVGATKMAVLSDVPNQMVYIIQAVIIIAFGARYAFRLFRRHQKEEPAPIQKGEK